MDELTYNASHAPDPVAYEAIKNADEMPYHIKGVISATKEIAKALNIRVENRMRIKDLETGRVWP